MDINKAKTLTKNITTTVVGLGSTRIVRTVVQNNVPTTNIYQKITVGAATVALGGLVSAATREETNRQVDELFKGIDAIKTSIDNAKNQDDK